MKEFKNLKEYGESKMEALQEMKENLIAEKIKEKGLWEAFKKDHSREKKRFSRIAQSDSEIYFYKAKGKFERIVTIGRNPEVKANKEGKILMSLKYY